MATKGNEIYSLEQKIRAIAETLFEIELLDSPSRREFADYADINYDTLKSAWAIGRLSPELQKKIADSSGFNVEETSWVDFDIPPNVRARNPDPSYPGRDTVDRFRRMLRTQHELTADLFIRVQEGRPKLFDANLVNFSVEDSGQETSKDQPVELLFSITIEPGHLPNKLLYGFNKVRLRLKFKDKSNSRLSRILGHANKIEFGNASIKSSGNVHVCSWTVTSRQAILDGEFVTQSHPLCHLQNSEIGEVFFAEVSVRPLDGSLMSVDGSELPPDAKCRIIEILSSKKLPNTADSQGWISIGIQELKLVRGS